jgi:hypothetical protein
METSCWATDVIPLPAVKLLIRRAASVVFSLVLPSTPLAGKRGAEGVACFIHPCKKPPHLWLTRDYGTWGPRGPEGFHNATFTIAESNIGGK